MFSPVERRRMYKLTSGEKLAIASILATAHHIPCQLKKVPKLKKGLR